MPSFHDQRVLITGASAGIGREFAMQLHAAGAHVTLVARREELLQELANNLNKERANSATFITADLSKLDDIKRVEAFIESNEVNIFIANAGRGSFGYFETIDRDAETVMISLNIVSQLRLTHAVIKQMKERRSGSIVIVSSIAGSQPLPYMSTYAATKAFNLFHSFGLRNELRSFGVKVLAVCPGPVETEFAGVARVPGTWTGGPRETVETVVKESLIALQKNKAFVVPGIKAKFMWLGSRLFPTYFTTWLTERMLRTALRRIS